VKNKLLHLTTKAYELAPSESGASDRGDC
jgi:hypothetical protein